MAWLKESDTAAYHPIVVRPLEFDDADDRTVNEVFGFVNRCATQAAAYETDYVVDLGTAKMLAGITRFNVLADQAVRAGYFTWVEVKGDDDQPRLALKLVEDKYLFHMFLQSEQEAAAQRKKDGRNTDLTVGARLRDGDQCRYCGNVVTFGNDRRSGRAGHYDHVHGIQLDKPTELKDYVVACRPCNQSKGDTYREPLPPPEEPHYSKITATFLKKHGHDVPTARRVPTRPVDPAQFTASQRQPVEQPPVAAPEDQATAPTGPDHALDTAPAREDAQEEPHDGGPEEARLIPADHRYPESSRVGSGLGAGRDGQGCDGSGGARSSPPAGTPPRSDPSPPRRKRRNRPRKRKPKA